MSEHSDTQKKILDAATVILLEQGIAKLSVRSISKLAGISTMGIYHHFDGKQDVLDALRIDGFELLAKAIEQSQQAQGPEAAITLGTENYLRIALENPAHYTLMFEPVAHGYSPTQATQKAATHSFSKLVECIANFPNLDKPANSIAIEIWALLHGFVGLKQQVTSGSITEQQWKAMALDAVHAHIKARQRSSH